MSELTPEQTARLDYMLSGKKEQPDEVARIRRLHIRAEHAAYECGRYDAAHGNGENPFSGPPSTECGMLYGAWQEGYSDEQAGKP